VLMGVGEAGLVIDIWGGGDANKESPDLRFPEVGISAKIFCGVSVYYVLVPTMISCV